MIDDRLGVVVPDHAADLALQLARHPPRLAIWSPTTISEAQPHPRGLIPLD